MKLTKAQIKPYREALLAQQGGRSALSNQVIQSGEAVLDHDHLTGRCRGVITRAENCVLGKVEKGKRYGKSFDVLAFAQGLHAYLTAPQGPEHPGKRIGQPKKRINRKSTTGRKVATGEKHATTSSFRKILPRNPN